MKNNILIDFVKYYPVLIISKLDSAKKIFDSLHILYEFNNTNRALALRRHLFHIQMARGESTISFMKTTKLKDQLSANVDSIEDKDLVMLAINGLSHSWVSFIQGNTGRDKLAYIYLIYIK